MEWFSLTDFPGKGMFFVGMCFHLSMLDDAEFKECSLCLKQKAVRLLAIT